MQAGVQGKTGRKSAAGSGGGQFLLAGGTTLSSVFRACGYESYVRTVGPERRWRSGRFYSVTSTEIVVQSPSIA